MKLKNLQVNFDCDMTGYPEILERLILVLNRKILLQPLRLVTVDLLLLCSAFVLSCPVLSYPILSCPVSALYNDIQYNYFIILIREKLA